MVVFRSETLASALPLRSEASALLSPIVPTAEQIRAIRAIPHVAHSNYGKADIGLIFAKYTVTLANQIYAYGRSPKTIADIGTGYGVLAIILALKTSAHVIATEYYDHRLEAAREVARIMGVDERIDWRLGSLPALPLRDREADTTFCVEVIEHIGDQPAVANDLARATRDLLIVTSPNRNFPVVLHDTRLPFCHLLPPRQRNRYASLFRRRHMQDGNRFWSHGMLEAGLQGFQRVSGFLQYPSYQHYAAAMRSIRDMTGMRTAIEKTYFRTASLAGPLARHFLPNIASAFVRVEARHETPGARHG